MNYHELHQNGWLQVDFYLSKSCNKSCYYCTAWTLEMRNLTVDMDFLRHTLECFKGTKLMAQILGGEPGLIKNLKEVVDEIKKYPEFRVAVLSNSLVRRKHPWVLEDPDIYYFEHLVLDFHEDRIEKLGGFDFFEENDLNNYNTIIQTPSYFKYIKNFDLNINHANTITKRYNSRSPEYDVEKQSPLRDRQICAKFPSVPVVDFELQKIRHCSKKVIDGSRQYEVTRENVQKMMNFELFEFENYCAVCTEQLPPYMGRTQDQILDILEKM